MIDGQLDGQSVECSNVVDHFHSADRDCSRERRSCFLCFGVRRNRRCFSRDPHQGRCGDFSFEGAVVDFMAMGGGIHKIREGHPTTKSTCPSAKLVSSRRRPSRRCNTPLCSPQLSCEPARSDLPAARFVGECLSERDSVSVCTLACDHTHSTSTSCAMACMLVHAYTSTPFGLKVISAISPLGVQVEAC